MDLRYVAGLALIHLYLFSISGFALSASPMIEVPQITTSRAVLRCREKRQAQCFRYVFMVAVDKV